MACRDVRRSFPYLPPQVGLARNVTALRTVGWQLARMAAINLRSDPFIVRSHKRSGCGWKRSR